MSEHHAHEHHDEHGQPQPHSYVHVYHHVPESVLALLTELVARIGGGTSGSDVSEVLTVLASITDTLSAIQQGETQIMASLDAITTAVAENTSVDQSAILLLNDIAARLAAAATDPAAVQALADELRASSADLAAAVVANTPAEAPPA